MLGVAIPMVLAFGGRDRSIPANLRPSFPHSKFQASQENLVSLCLRGNSLINKKGKCIYFVSL